VLPGAGLSYSLVTRYLDYDDLQGYDEDGFSSGDFAAYAYTLEAGVSGVLGSLEWGLQGGYARYDIETESSHAGFGNAGVSLNLPHNLRVAWVLSNLGYGTPFVNRPVILPLTLQTGIAHHLKIGNRFAWNSFMDFRRRNDESGVYIPGAEVVYAKILSLRSGYALGEKRPVVTGGFGVNLSPLRIAYAYRGHEALAGAHFLSFETLF
jgi:hypothetical protein